MGVGKGSVLSTDEVTIEFVQEPYKKNDYWLFLINRFYIQLHNNTDRTIYIDLVNQKLTFGYLNTKNIEITKVGFKLKKEIPVYSQEQYTVLAKLKQLRYYVKQLTPTLKASMDLIKEERIY